MELTAKVASLEDEVKLLKGEVKLILSEIRTAILGQDNPFTEPGQALRPVPGAIDSRPPIRVVRVPSENEEPEVVAPPPEPPSDTIWEEPEGPAPEPMTPEEPPETPLPEEQPSTPPKPVMKAPTSFVPPPAPIIAHPFEPEPAATPAPQPTRPVAVGTPRWSLITVAGLAVWAEEALKQIGPKRLRILLDLCEFTGYVTGDTKEALLKVTSLSRSTEERKTVPSTNECLVVLCQLDALLRGDQPAGLSFSNTAAKWQQTA